MGPLAPRIDWYGTKLRRLAQYVESPAPPELEEALQLALQLDRDADEERSTANCILTPFVGLPWIRVCNCSSFRYPRTGGTTRRRRAPAWTARKGRSPHWDEKNSKKQSRNGGSRSAGLRHTRSLEGARPGDEAPVVKWSQWASDQTQSRLAPNVARLVHHPAAYRSRDGDPT